MRKLIKIILPEVRVGDLKIRPRGDNRCESAKSVMTAINPSPDLTLHHLHLAKPQSHIQSTPYLPTPTMSTSSPTSSPLQTLSTTYQTLQTSLQPLIAARQKLESQQQENQSVQKVRFHSPFPLSPLPSLPSPSPSFPNPTPHCPSVCFKSAPHWHIFDLGRNSPPCPPPPRSTSSSGPFSWRRSAAKPWWRWREGWSLLRRKCTVPRLPSVLHSLPHSRTLSPHTALPPPLSFPQPNNPPHHSIPTAWLTSVPLQKESESRPRFKTSKPRARAWRWKFVPPPPLPPSHFLVLF